MYQESDGLNHCQNSPYQHSEEQQITDKKIPRDYGGKDKSHQEMLATTKQITMNND